MGITACHPYHSRFRNGNILHIDPLAVECLYKILNEGKVRTIITDVTMAAAGIRKGALERMGIGVKCYLGDERAAALAKEKESPVHRPVYVWQQRNIRKLYMYSVMPLQH